MQAGTSMTTNPDTLSLEALRWLVADALPEMQEPERNGALGFWAWRPKRGLEAEEALLRATANPGRYSLDTVLGKWLAAKEVK